MSRDHDAPLEYLRILASLKLRFGLAALATAHGALPVVYPMLAWDTHLPNGCVGHSASQWLRGSSSFQMNVTGRPAEIPIVQNAHPLRPADLSPVQRARCPFSLTALWAETVHVVSFSHSQDRPTPLMVALENVLGGMEMPPKLTGMVRPQIHIPVDRSSDET